MRRIPSWTLILLLPGLLLGALSTLARAQDASTDDGSTQIRLPSGQPPSSGWPVLLLMHGYGGSAARIQPLAEVISRAGVAVISPNGTRSLSAGRHSWDAAEVTHATLERELEQAAAKHSVNTRNVFVGGYSQGAGLALSLVTRHPEQYAGALAIAPAGHPPAGEHSSGLQRMVILVGDADSASLALAEAYEAYWQASGQSHRVLRYSGGHTPPADIMDSIQQQLPWLLRGVAR